MSNSHIIKKALVFIAIGVFLGTSTISAIGNYTFSINYNNYKNIGINDAMKVANTKLNELKKTDFKIESLIEIGQLKDIVLYYAFELNPQGYIVVSGSYDLPPIIAYSFTSGFKDPKYQNVLSEILKADMKLRLENIPELPQSMIQERHDSWDTYLEGTIPPLGQFEQWPPEGSTPTGGWLLENWHQSPPYNNLCPLDIYNGGGRSVAGCPAVAMAQILNFHNTTKNILFNDQDGYYHNFAGNQYWIDNDYITYNFSSFPQLNSYLASLQNKYETHVPPTNTEKAAIVFACGIAAHQVYSSSVSGTYGVNQALQAYQRFNCSTVELLHENNPNLYGRLAHNIMDALPAHLAVENSQGNMGHNVVVDGYNTNNYYHINFGWGGSYNGWYIIPDEIPYGLTVVEGLIVDILKQNTGIPDISCEGTLSWTNVNPEDVVTGSFTVSNIGEAGSDLAWQIIEWPTWGTWTFSPEYEHNLRPEDGPKTINVSVIPPDQYNHEYTGNIKIVNIDNINDYQIIPVYLKTNEETKADLDCDGTLIWTDIETKAVVTGNFTLENIGTSFTNLSWKVTSWPYWGAWTFTPNQGGHLTPEDGPITIDVTVTAPEKKKTKFIGQIKIVNTENSSDYDIIQVSLATPHTYSSLLPHILKILKDRFVHIVPLYLVLFG